jgi:hypothetical protein
MKNLILLTACSVLFLACNREDTTTTDTSYGTGTPAGNTMGTGGTTSARPARWWTAFSRCGGAARYNRLTKQAGCARNAMHQTPATAFDLQPPMRFSLVPK